MDDEETAEELAALRRQTDALWQQTEALQETIEELSATLFGSPDQALRWANALEEIAAKRELFRDDDAGVPWLRKVRERLIDKHNLLPMVEITSAGARLRRPPLRERLSVLPGGLQTPSTAVPTSPTFPDAPFPEPPDTA